MRIQTLSFAAISLLLSAKAVGEEKAPVVVPVGVYRMGDGALFPQYALVVDKSKKKLHVLDNSTKIPTLIDTFDSDLGKKPGNKHSTGDARTPEGIYFFNKIMESHELDYVKYGVRAFVTDYPNFFDIREGKSGYGIWLHAIDEKVGLDRGSRGCVVVRNDTIKKLSKYITLKETPLMIFDKVDWVSFDVAKKDSDTFLQFLDRWRKSWETKQIDDYISLYSEDFKFGKMNKEIFKRYKTELAEKYKDIKVSLSMPVIYSHKEKTIIKFFQDYSSSEHADFGQKTLYVKKVGSDYKIEGEEWAPSTGGLTRSVLAGTNLCCQATN